MILLRFKASQLVSEYPSFQNGAILMFSFNKVILEHLVRQKQNSYILLVFVHELVTWNCKVAF